MIKSIEIVTSKSVAGWVGLNGQWVGLGWVGKRYGLSGLGWVGLRSWWVGLGWVLKNGPTDNSGIRIKAMLLIADHIIEE